jgi:uracil-DNA glycosylase family 4
VPWTERQAALLRAMGLRLWQPPPAAPVPETGPSTVPAGARSPAPASTDEVDEVAGVAASAAPVAAPPSVPVAAPPSVPVASPPSVPSAVPPSVRIAASSVPGLDWPALREAVAACRACALCESRTQTVFGVGSTQAQWMVVGEAPGEQEDAQGEPFVGPSGQLLDAMLRALSLSRADDGGPAAQRVYIANTLKCRPPRNRNPTPDEMLKCEPFLVRQIQLLQPRIILAMGRFAVQALLRSSEPIGKLRGRVHAYQGVPLVVTYHPAYLLRNPPDKARAWEDLCLAAAVAEGGRS